MAEKGFQIGGKTYPLVRYEEWFNTDYVLARRLTHVTTQDLFEDPILLEQALLAIAFQHENPHLRQDQVIAYIGNLKPSDWEDVGFDEEDIPDPLAGGEEKQNDDSSSPSSDESTEPNPEESATTSSGSPGSATTSPVLTSHAGRSDS